MTNIMKAILKLLGGCLIGIVVGLAIAAIIIVLFTDTTFIEFLDKLHSADVLKSAMAALVGMLAFMLSLLILIPAHEAGHLVCGLLTGYKFVSFRIFNFTFIKKDGKLRVKKFSIAGTGGQCLLTPPDLPIERIPTLLYNAGGVLANILLLLMVLPLFLLSLHPYVFESLAIFCIADVFLILMNGIPMKINGISNDAYNMLYLNRNILSKQAIVMQLRTNALIQDGMSPKDMPSEWFKFKTDIDYKNPLEVSIPLMHASRLLDEMCWEEAYAEFEQLYSHKTDIIQLYVNEIACELAFCSMVTGRKEEARVLLDAKLKKYIESYKKVMSSKQRILCAIALYLDDDRKKAEEIYDSLKSNCGRYLLQGEVKSDLSIMHRMMNENPLI